MKKAYLKREQVTCRKHVKLDYEEDGYIASLFDARGY